MARTRQYAEMIVRMADGTIKQVNPLTGRESWYVPGRGNRPLPHHKPDQQKPIQAKEKEDYCSFCTERYLETPPEKSRLVRSESGYRTLYRLMPHQLNETTPLFRRLANLFEIVTTEYWEKNYDYTLSPELQAWKETYLSNPAGQKHAFGVVDAKLRMMGKSPEQIAAITDFPEREKMCDAFFGGGHELIVAGRHYREGAKFDHELYSSGEMSEEDHYQYIRFTIEAVQDLYRTNRYIRYVVVFQNWLAPAGASFEHLHKQLVGLDEWGTDMENEVEVARENPNAYNELVVNFASYTNRVIAENDHAIAFVDIGHRFPTVAIYSKSRNLRPSEHDPEEVRGMSDLLHACHAATGSSVSCNEEWYFMPEDCLDKIPWHIMIKWRVNNPAGFEGGTQIYINPMSYIQLRDQIVPRLYQLRDQGRITNMRIGPECRLTPNPLMYNRP